MSTDYKPLQLHTIKLCSRYFAILAIDFYREFSSIDLDVFANRHG